MPNYFTKFNIGTKQHELLHDYSVVLRCTDLLLAFVESHFTFFLTVPGILNSELHFF